MPTLPSPFFAVFDADTLAAKTAWKAAGGTHVVISATWDQLETSQGSLSSTALTALKQQFADAATQSLGVIFSFSTHYAPAWAQTAGVKFRNQAGVDHVGTGSLGDKVIDAVWSQTSRDLVASFQTQLWTALTAPERAQVVGFRVGGGPYGELHYPITGDWWGYSSPAQTGAGLATGQVVCPVPGHVPFVAYSTGGLLSTNAYGIEASAAAWESTATGITVSRVTTQAAEGTASLQVVQTTGSERAQARLVSGERPAASAGQTINVRIDGRNVSSGRTGAVGIQWYNGTTLLSTTWGADVALSSTEWRPMTASGVAPATTTGFGIIAGLSPNAAASSQGFLLDRVNAYSGASPDVQFTEWYLDGLSNYMIWQVGRLRTLGYAGTVHVLHPGFGFRSNFSFGSANYIAQAKEGVDWTRQIAAYPDSEVHPQSTWANDTPFPDPPVADSDKATWDKLLEIATAAGRASLMGGENTGGSDPNFDDNADVDYMFSAAGPYAPGRYAGLTWLKYPRLAGQESGTHATLSHLSGYMVGTTVDVVKVSYVGAPFAVTPVPATATPPVVAGSTVVEAPVVILGAPATSSPALTSMTTTVLAPTVTSGTQAASTPALVPMVTTFGAVTTSATTPATGTPAQVALTTTVGTPTSGSPVAVAPELVAATTTVPTVTLAAGTGTTTAPVRVEASTTVEAVSLAAGGGATATPARADGSATVPAPTVLLPQTVSVVKVSHEGVAHTPTGVSVAPDTVSLAASFPDGFVDHLVVPDRAELVTSFPAPTVSSGQLATASPALVAASTVVPEPTAGADGDVAVARIEMLGQVPTPSSSSGTAATVTPEVLDGSLSVEQPATDAAVGTTALPATVSGTTAFGGLAATAGAGADAVVVPVELRADVPLPVITVSQDGTVLPSRLVLTSEFLAPTVESTVTTSVVPSTVSFVSSLPGASAESGQAATATPAAAGFILVDPTPGFASTSPAGAEPDTVIFTLVSSDVGTGSSSLSAPAAVAGRLIFSPFELPGSYRDVSFTATLVPATWSAVLEAT